MGTKHSFTLTIIACSIVIFHFLFSQSSIVFGCCPSGQKCSTICYGGGQGQPVCWPGTCVAHTATPVPPPPPAATNTPVPPAGCDESLCSSWSNGSCGGCDVDGRDARPYNRTCPSGSTCSTYQCRDECGSTPVSTDTPTPTPTNTPTRTPTPTPTNTPTPTLPVPTNFGGVCNTFGGPVSLNWQYTQTNNENGYRVARTHVSGTGYADQHWPLGTVSSINTTTYTDIRNVPGPPENEILVGPYNYYVRSCYDYTAAASCGSWTNALVVNCPTPPPLRNLDATCTYPFGPIDLFWAQSAVAPAVAETNRHIAKYAGSWNYRYESLAGSALSYTDNAINITPGVQYGYNIRRCYTEYGTGDGDCRYISGYANQDNVTCNIRARCDTMSLGLPSEGCWIDGTLTRCVRGSTVSGTASGYNGTLSTPPFDTVVNWDKTTVARALYPTPTRVAVNAGSNTVSYTIPADETIQLETEIEFNTNMSWRGSTVYDPASNSQVYPICVRGDEWGPSAPVVGAECDNSCTAKIRVSCNVNVWSNWTSCSVNSNTSYTYCTRTRTNECLIPQTEECPGLLPDPTRTFCMGPTYTPTQTHTPTRTPTITNTPVPGATNTPIPPSNTPTPTLPPTSTPTPTTIPATATPTPTPTEPAGQPTFNGEVFYDFNQNGTMDQSCASGAIYEWLGSTNFGGTGNNCADKSALTALEALIGPIPNSLNGFQLVAEGLGGTSLIYGENPKFRINGVNRFYYFTVQNSNNYRLTVTDPQSTIRNCSITSTNPRNVYVGTTNTPDINVGVYCNPMPTHTPTLIPTLPVNTSTPTPTNTPTAVPLPELVITGSFNQQTGAYIRSAPGQFSGKKLPVGNVNVQDFMSPGSCAESTCSNIAGSGEGWGVPSQFYIGYRCTIQLPVGCPLIIPQPLVHIAGSSTSSYYSYYGNGSGTFAVPGSFPPTSYTAPVVFTYQAPGGWLKVIGGDIIRANSIGTFTNNIPFITDRFNAVNGGNIYVTGDAKDLGHASLLDVFKTGDVGGVAAGDFDTMPADTVSEYGGSVSSYSLGSTTIENQQLLAALVQKMLISKPISNLGSFGNLRAPLQLTLEPDVIYTNNYGDGVISIEIININSNSQNILIITDTNGNLSDVTFSNDIDPTEASSLVVIAKNVYLSTNVGFANAVFITSGKFFTGSGGKPLKIKGNVVALGGIEQQRSRFDGDRARPTLLIEFDAQVYLNALKLMNVSTLEYRVTN